MRRVGGRGQSSRVSVNPQTRRLQLRVEWNETERDGTQAAVVEVAEVTVRLRVV